MSLINKEVSEFSVQAFQDNAFKTVTKADILGKWSVFFFYPADFTFVCPTELEDLAEKYEDFKSIGCEIYSVSCDSHFVHKAWHDASKTIQNIKYPMLADPTGALARDFDVMIESEGMAERGSFIVNPEGRIVAYEVIAGNVGRNADELFRRVTGMDVRVAVPEAGITEESKEKIADPAYSTAVGILLKGAEQGGCAVVERPAAPRPEMRQPAPQPPVGGYKAPQPRVAQPYAAPAKPVPQPVPQPEAEPAEEQDAPREDERPPVVEPKRKRGFGSIVMSAIDKINKGFSAAEDEEI